MRAELRKVQPSSARPRYCQTPVYAILDGSRDGWPSWASGLFSRPSYFAAVQPPTAPPQPTILNPSSFCLRAISKRPRVVCSLRWIDARDSWRRITLPAHLVPLSAGHFMLSTREPPHALIRCHSYWLHRLPGSDVHPKLGVCLIWRPVAASTKFRALGPADGQATGTNHHATLPWTLHACITRPNMHDM